DEIAIRAQAVKVDGRAAASALAAGARVAANSETRQLIERVDDGDDATLLYRVLADRDDGADSRVVSATLDERTRDNHFLQLIVCARCVLRECRSECNRTGDHRCGNC